MSDIKIEARALLVDYAARVGVAVFRDTRTPMGYLKRELATITWAEVDECAPITPTFEVRKRDAQVLMDDLWKAGLRPTEGSGSAGSLAATERHLADLQKIAFGFLKKDGVA